MYMHGNIYLCFASLVPWLCLMINVGKASEYCDSKVKSSDRDQARILSGLANLRFSAESRYDGSATEYTVGVCGNASKADPLAAVIQNYTTVLGRVNNTSVVKGGDWMMMIFGSGDMYPEKHNCSGPRVAFVMIHCNHNISAENSLRFIKEAKEEKYSCFFMLEVYSQLVCVQSERSSGITLVILLLLFAIVSYIVGGVLYRRLLLGAKGLEQIPNLDLWRYTCQCLADTCCICCKQNIIHTNPWENLSSRVERDDDSLLPP